MFTPTDILQAGAAIAVTLLVGSWLAEGFILVPLWRESTAEAFHTLYARLHRLLYRYFTPLTVLALVASLASGVASMVAGDSRRWLATGVFGLCLATAATHEIYFKRANDAFAGGRMNDDELAAELRSWAAWHWWRTGLGGLAVVLAMAVVAE